MNGFYLKKNNFQTGSTGLLGFFNPQCPEENEEN